MNELSVIKDYSDMEKAATAMAASGFFLDAKSAAQAMVKIMAGAEMGFGAFASMTGIYIISGRPSVGANIMAAAVKGSHKYDYRVVEMTDTVCEIAFFQGTQDIGHSRFTIDDAKKAQTKNLDKFARNMLFARAMSNGVRWYTPDVFSGSAVYTPEELGATIDERGNVLDMKFTEPATAPQNSPAQHEKQAPRENVQPITIDVTDEMIDIEVNSDGTKYTDIPTNKLALMGKAMLKKINAGEYTDEELVEKSRKLAVIDTIILLRLPAQS